jgi:hypothetical protein
MTTPSGKKDKSQNRSSSPRPISNSPSDYLLRTTAARVCDGNALEQRRSSLIVPEHKTPSKAPIPPPSDSLMKTTQARLSDVREWHAQRGIVKHQDDIWWEQRKPLENASKSNLNSKVQSRLYEPTTSLIYSQRKKFPARTTPDKHATPGSGEKSPALLSQPPLNISKIDASSPLLRSTFNSVVKNVKNSPAPPPPPGPEIFTQNSGPQNVPSRLFSPTANLERSKWKSKEELAAEEAAAAAAQAAYARKVKEPSPHLVAYNASLRSSARGKAEKAEADQREAGWSNGYVKLSIPSVEAVPPLPNERPGASPYRRRDDGGTTLRQSFGGTTSRSPEDRRLSAEARGNSNSNYSMNSTIDSAEDPVQHPAAAAAAAAAASSSFPSSSAMQGEQQQEQQSEAMEYTATALEVPVQEEEFESY